MRGAREKSHGEGGRNPAELENARVTLEKKKKKKKGIEIGFLGGKGEFWGRGGTCMFHIRHFLWC